MKSLINPLLVFLLLQIGVASYLWRNHKGFERALLLLFLCSEVLFGVLSMSFSRTVLETSL